MKTELKATNSNKNDNNNWEEIKMDKMKFNHSFWNYKHASREQWAVSSEQWAISRSSSQLQNKLKYPNNEFGWRSTISDRRGLRADRVWYFRFWLGMLDVNELDFEFVFSFLVIIITEKVKTAFFIRSISTPPKTDRKRFINIQIYIYVLLDTPQIIRM